MQRLHERVTPMLLDLTILFALACIALWWAQAVRP